LVVGKVLPAAVLALIFVSGNRGRCRERPCHREHVADLAAPTEVAVDVVIKATSSPITAAPPAHAARMAHPPSNDVTRPDALIGVMECQWTPGHVAAGRDTAIRSPREIVTSVSLSCA
jgi:hypothetical protein